MGVLIYKKMTDWDSRTTFVEDTDNEVKVSKVRKTIEGILQVPPFTIDIVQRCNIKGNDDTVTLDTIVEVIVHPKDRHLPSHLRTSEPDCMTGDTDEVTSRLTCHHTIAPDMLYSSCLSQLNDRKTFFTCPVSICHAKLEFEEVIEKACLSDDEISFFEQRVNKNTVEKGKACPGCTSYCERIDENNPRVECCYCRKQGKAAYEFCWSCGFNWENGHICRPQKEELQRQLQNCERIKMAYNGMENVPKLRACPKCKVFIEHAGGCKTMTCKFCNQIFCFCCLKLAEKGILQCGDHSVVCTVAPTQIV